MEKLFFIVISSLFLICCSSSNNTIETPQDNSIIGSWQLVQAYIASGGSNNAWRDIENRYVYVLKEDGTFTSTRFDACDKGEYSYNETSLTLAFHCENFTMGIETPEGTFVESASMEDGFLVLSPTYLSCDEGCLFRFSKISIF